MNIHDPYYWVLPQHETKKNGRGTHETKKDGAPNNCS